MTLKATCIANSNIALVKYWGKRNEEMVLPYNSSISITVDDLEAKTTVEFSKNYQEDAFIINGNVVEKDSQEYHRLSKFVTMFKRLGGVREFKVRVESSVNFPVAAGLASSAAGYAALAGALDQALSLNYDRIELSKLARLGSGSACRSVYGGFVEWKRGELDDGSDSYAEQIANENYWKEFKVIFCLTSEEHKKISSREGMAQSVKTSPYYESWINTTQAEIEPMKNAIISKSISKVGEIAESSCLKMHSVMLTTKPPLIYWNPVTVEIMKKILTMRETGIDAYFTIDAGPQVKVLSLENQVEEITKHLKNIKGILGIKVVGPGKGLRKSEQHLF